MSKTKYKKYLVSLLPLIIGGAAIVHSNAAEAQTLPQNAGSDCSNILSNCPPAQNNDVTQEQSGNVSANINIYGETIEINVPGYDGTGDSPAYMTADSIVSSSSAIGNTVSAKAPSDVVLNFSSSQTLNGDVTAGNSVTTTSAVPGTVSMFTTSYGNAAQAEACCADMNFQATQITNGTANVSAYSHVDTAPNLGTLIVSTQASANNAGLNTNGGLINAVYEQWNAGTVNATTNSTNCCNIDGVSTNALATGNTTTSTSNSATSYNWVMQTNYGSINSNSEHDTDNGPYNSITAQSVGNSAYTSNIAGYTQLHSAQYSDGNINSYARGNSNYYTGSMIVGSAAQGNSSVLSSIGSDGSLVVTQETGYLGTINSTTDFNGFSNYGVGYATASASGNALVGFACSSCEAGGINFTGASYQTNNAAQTATININNNVYGSASGYGVAAGNSATYTAQNGKNY